MAEDGEGFLRPVVERDNCIDCGACSRACPVLTEEEPGAGNTVAFGAFNRDAEVRLGSTSGGVFTLLAQWVIQRGGVVFGAAYDEKFDVRHCRVEDMSRLGILRGAKYAQSLLGDTFLQVKTCLNEGRYVLFSGTPCQIGGLRAYLGTDCERLLLVDVICHGVPSPWVWRHYINFRSGVDADGAFPVGINLRSKTTGWPGYSVQFDYKDYPSYSRINRLDPYLRGFVSDLYLRPSCYECRFKGIRRQSDFTLGDYWGVWDQLPEYHDQKGVSLVLLHTEKAVGIWRELSQKLEAARVDTEKSLSGNPSAVLSAKRPLDRATFFARMKDEDFQELVDELSPVTQVAQKKSGLVLRALRKIRSMI